MRPLNHARLAQERAGQRSQTASLPAPIGGLNSRDSIDAMPPTDAILLDNWSPDSDAVRLRPGYASHATGVGAATDDVESLLQWEGPAGSKLLAVAGGGVFDASAAGAATQIAAVSTYSNSRFQWVNAGGYVITCNGSDTPWRYDSTSGLVDLTFTGTGLTQSDLINVELYKSRLYFAEKDSASFWYGATGAVTGGTLTEFDLSQIARRGGSLQAVAGWSTDVSDSIAEYVAFIMTTGEVIVYSGSDPGDASFAILGRYEAGEPIGRRCFLKQGGDVVLITRQGFVPLSFLIGGGTIDQLSQSRTWGKIKSEVQRIGDLHNANFGWAGIITATGQKLYVNVPVQEGVTYYQYVQDTVSGAWSRYTGLPSVSWARFGDTLYFGGPDGTVYKHTGTSDAGNDIQAKARTAFTYFGSRDRKKRFTAIRPIIYTDGLFTASVGLNVDFGNAGFPSNNVNLESNSVGADWDEEFWDDAIWADQATPTTTWVSVGGMGRNASVELSLATSTQTIAWYATDFQGTIGGIR